MSLPTRPARALRPLLIGAYRVGKIYQRRRGPWKEALCRLGLTLRHGEIVGLIGPNGAGKTTLIRLVLGYLRPSRGTVRRGGYPEAQPGWGRAVYVPEGGSVPPFLTGREYLKFHLGGLDLLRFRSWGALHPLLARWEVLGLLDRRLAHWSPGERQRLLLAIVEAARPQLAILDEPTNFLDPVARIHFRELLLRLRSWGAGVLVSSHVIADLDGVTDRILVLRDGQIKAELDPASVPQVGGSVRLIVEGMRRERLAALGSTAETAVADRRGYLVIEVEEPSPSSLHRISKLGGWVAGIDRSPTRLERTVMRLLAS